MFKGDTVELSDTLKDACSQGRRLGHRRVGSEHVLLALSNADGTVGRILREAGVTPEAVLSVIGRARVGPAVVEADRAALRSIRLDDHALREDAIEQFGPEVFDPRPRGRRPLLPLGARRAERLCAAMRPPIGHDAQALYEASLRLALARRDRGHDLHHLLLAMLWVDRGVSWLIGELGVDRASLRSAVDTAFPLRRANLLMHIERQLAWQHRSWQIRRRYMLRTGS